jgi:hypothetical protein
VFNLIKFALFCIQHDEAACTIIILDTVHCLKEALYLIYTSFGRSWIHYSRNVIGCHYIDRLLLVV